MSEIPTRLVRHIQFFDKKEDWLVFQIKLQDNLTIEFLRTIVQDYYDADVWSLSKEQFKKLKPYLEGTFNYDRYWDEYEIALECNGIYKED